MSEQGREDRSEERARSGAPRGSESSTPSIRRVVALVSGDVQGVGYRWFVRGLASPAGVAGSARNLPDGRVEVVLEGAEAGVAAVVDALGGPDAPGSVSGVDLRDEPAVGSTGFTTA